VFSSQAESIVEGLLDKLHRHSPVSGHPFSSLGSRSRLLWAG